MKAKAQIGSVSTGSVNCDDLIPAFIQEIRRLRGSLPKELAKLEQRYCSRDPGCFDEQEFVDSLIDLLNEYAPPYCYFGAHHGDGADFGFWLCDDWHEQCTENATGDSRYLRVSDTAQVPAKFTGEVLHINDHGNATLYSARKGKLTEIWSVV